MDGTRNVGPGELAVPCLACPKLGVNLPENWNNVSDDLRCVLTDLNGIVAVTNVI